MFKKKSQIDKEMEKKNTALFIKWLQSMLKWKMKQSQEKIKAKVVHQV